ncbi:intersectin-EH binding protein Ibp1 [Mycolicibacterium thermoresistibile]
MAAQLDFARRILTAGGLALAVVAAPLIGAPAVSSPPAVAATEECPAGEEIDVFTGECVPFAVPNSPFVGIPGNPDVPAVDTGAGAVPCPLPQNCIGLGQSQVTGPTARPAPESSVGGSPTITGQLGS